MLTRITCISRVSRAVRNNDSCIFESLLCRWHLMRVSGRYNVSHTTAVGPRNRTIYAISSGKGKCGVSVIRVSGSDAKSVIRCMTAVKAGDLTKIEARKMYLSKIVDPHTEEMLDKGFFVWFPGPHSFTGEDVCELHIHGGTAVIAGIMNALGKLPNFFPAEKGEFTKRAFMNGKLDLTEVEGLADVISAETEAQRRQALRQMEGSLHKQYMAWRQSLKICLANIEAYIDFAEDQHIDDDIEQKVAADIKKLASEIESHLSDNRRGERIRSGIRIAILGEPNVGKSTLLNVLCQKNAAIVSPFAGTTRDVIEVSLDIGGYPVILTDTAGIRETADYVEQEGVRRALNSASQADIIVLVTEPSFLTKLDAENTGKHIIQSKLVAAAIRSLGLSIVSSESQDQLPDNRNIYIADDCRVILVVNKMDLVQRKLEQRIAEKDNTSFVTMSCKTGENLDRFITCLAETVKSMCGNPLSENPALTQVRHRHHLEKCLSYLREYLRSADQVIAAEKIRKAMVHLGKITGKVTTEEILDVIFKEFCIGK